MGQVELSYKIKPIRTSERSSYTEKSLWKCSTRTIARNYGVKDNVLFLFFLQVLYIFETDLLAVEKQHFWKLWHVEDLQMVVY